MVLHDANGRITIDENAAYRDIKRLKDAMEILISAQKSIEQVSIMSSEFSGKIANVQSIKAQMLRSEIHSEIQLIQKTIDVINHTVKYYQKIDMQLRDVINQK